MGVRLSDQHRSILKIGNENFLFIGLEKSPESEYVEAYIEFRLTNIEGPEGHHCLSLTPRLIGGHRIAPIECKAVSMLNERVGMKYLFVEELPFVNDESKEQFNKECQNCSKEEALVWLTEYFTRGIRDYFNIYVELGQSEGKYLLDVEFYRETKLKILWSYELLGSNDELAKFFRPRH